MKRIGSIVALLVFGFCIYATAQDSLAEAARHNRQSKKTGAAKVYTNDDFAPVAPAPAVTATEPSDKADKADKDADAAKAKAADDKTKLSAAFKARADEQKKNISQLERELDVAQREYRLKVAVYYADAGNSLRDGKKFAEEDKKQKAEIDAKQKAVADAKQKLADIQEDARKAGLKAE